MRLEKLNDTVLVLSVGDEYVCDIDVDNEEDATFFSYVKNILGEELEGYLFMRDKKEQKSLPRLDEIVYTETKEAFIGHVREVRDKFDNFCKHYEKWRYETE